MPPVTQGQWPYVIAAYVIGIGAVKWLVIASWLGMRRAERRRDAARGK